MSCRESVTGSVDTSLKSLDISHMANCGRGVFGVGRTRRTEVRGSGETWADVLHKAVMSCFSNVQLMLVDTRDTSAAALTLYGVCGNCKGVAQSGAFIFSSQDGIVPCGTGRSLMAPGLTVSTADNDYFSVIIRHCNQRCSDFLSCAVLLATTALTASHNNQLYNAVWGVVDRARCRTTARHKAYCMHRWLHHHQQLLF